MFDDFLPEVLEQAAAPTGGDEPVADFAMRMVMAMGEPGVFSGIKRLITGIHTERPMGASHMFNLLLRGVQMQALRDFPEYPSRIDPRRDDRFSFWDDLIRRTIGGDEPGRWQELHTVMGTRRPVTNVIRRKIGVALLEQLLGPPHVAIEAGCSQNLIGKSLVLGTPLIEDISAVHRMADREPRTSRELSAMTLGLVNRVEHNVLRIGVDLNGANPDDLLWFRASPYPGELLDAEKVAQTEALINTQLPEHRLQFHQLDFTDPKQVEAFLENLQAAERRYGLGASPLSSCGGSREQESGHGSGLGEDVRRYVYLITSAYEDPEMLEAAKKVAGPAGVIAVQDHVEIDKDDPTRLHFSRHWPEWGYRLLVLQMAHADRGWQHIMTGRTSRLREIEFGDGRLMVGGKPRTTVELLFRAVRRLRSGA